MKPILVTGGTGFIGSHTALLLMEAGLDVVIIDNLVNSEESVIGRIESICGKRPSFYPIDIQDETKLTNLFSRYDFEAVIHFAALKSVAQSVATPLSYFHNNVGGTINLLSAMKKAGVKKLVYSSSATVYGKPKQVPIFEDDPVLSAYTANPYGRTKVICEEILRDVCIADPAFSAIALRYFNPIGAHPSGNLGENPKGVPANLMPIMVSVALKQLPFLQVTGAEYDTPDGSGIRDYIHVMDLANGHLAALDYTRKSCGFDAVNLGCGRGYSVFELIRIFEEVNEVTIPYKVTENRPGDIAASWADVSKADALLGWKSRAGIEEMCRDAWNWGRNNYFASLSL